MGNWAFTTANALTAQGWVKKWWASAKTESYFYSNGYIGPSEKSDIIVEFGELEGNPGYQLTYGQVRNLSGSGVTGDTNPEGQEEEPTTYDDQITINQRRNAIRSDGYLSEQYKSDQRFRMWAKDLLDTWMGGMIDQDFFTALGSSLTKVIYGGDATATTDIEAGDYFTLALISKCQAYAMKATPKIEGKPMKGLRSHVVVISPDQSFDLTTRDSSWNQSRMTAAVQGKDNPLFKGALGEHMGAIIQCHERVATATTWGSGANLPGATALFLGVGAAAIAYFKRKYWNEKTFAYGAQVGFCVGAGYGTSKSVFNSADNAVVGIRTYRTNN